LALAERYLAADQAGRRALLASTVDRAPLPAVAAAGAWIAPRAVNSLEYFASASDISRVYASLAALARRPGPDRPDATSVTVVAIAVVVRVTNEPWRAREESPPIEGPRR